MAEGSREIKQETVKAVTFDGQISGNNPRGEAVVSDEVEFAVKRGNDSISVSFYLGILLQMRSAVLTIWIPLSKGYYSVGNYAASAELPLDLTRNSTNWFYFSAILISIQTAVIGHLVCYGDSITS